MALKNSLGPVQTARKSGDERRFCTRIPIDRHFGHTHHGEMYTDFERSPLFYFSMQHVSLSGRPPGANGNSTCDHA